MEKKQEPSNEAFQRGICNKLWISKRTKQLRMNLKRHLTMKYLSVLNTTYLVFIEYQRRKRKTPFGPYKDKIECQQRKRKNTFWSL